MYYAVDVMCDRTMLYYLPGLGRSTLSNFIEQLVESVAAACVQVDLDDKQRYARKKASDAAAAEEQAGSSKAGGGSEEGSSRQEGGATTTASQSREVRGGVYVGVWVGLPLPSPLYGCCTDADSV
jgi:hypothetical protein